MLKNPLNRTFAFRSDSESSNATATKELQSTRSNGTAAVSDAEIKEAAQEVNKEVEISESYPQKYVDNFEERIMAPLESGYYTFAKQYSTENQATIESTVKKIAVMASATVDFNAVEEGISGFVEGTKVLMRGLDEVAKLHPFIGVAVLAFKAVVMLELKRRDNDKKVIALKMEMADMMAVLLELRFVTDPELPGPDGTTLVGRTQHLVKKIAKDIVACGNVCDTYAKKGLVVKVLKGPVYEGRLADYAALFSERRKQIRLALQIHTALGVDSANHTISDMRQDVRAVDEKLNMILLFRRLDSPHEKELLRLIEQRGGPKTCLGSDTILRELTAVNSTVDPAAALSSLRDPLTPSSQGSQNFDAKAFYAMRSELREDMQDALQKNLTVFDRKLEVQKRQLITEIEGVITQEGDRIILAFEAGPHNRIIDPDLHKLWQDMGWRSSVKARHFVLALHDYFFEKLRDPGFLGAGDVSLRTISPTPSAMSDLSSESGTGTDSLSDAFHNSLPIHRVRRMQNDRWYLGYLNMLRLQPLIECFDDDGTGWITVKEANQLTTSRPKDWSLLRWLAFWAAGWHASIWSYRTKICGILLIISEDLQGVLHTNRVIVDGYLSDPVFLKLDLLIRSVLPTVNHDAELEISMMPYVQQEEQRIDENLRAVAFDIDDQNTLSLITGPGRIERYIFPLIFLLLRSHSRIIKVARTEVLHKNEFNKAIQSFTQIFNAVQERINTLSAIFRQQNLEVSSQFSHFAFGMFHFLGEPGKHLDKSQGNPIFVSWEDETHFEGVQPTILRYGTFDEFDLGGRYHELPPFSVKEAVPEFPPIEGAWSGHFFLDVFETRTDGLVDIVITSCSIHGNFEGHGFEATDGKFAVHGKILPKEGSTFKIEFTRKYPSTAARASIVCVGEVDSLANSIKGEWGFTLDHLGEPAFLTRTPAPLYRFRYTKVAFESNRSRARWSFACSVVRHQVRQRNCSWAFIQENIARRKRFVYLHIRRDLGWSWYAPLDDLKEEEADELLSLELSTCPYDNRLFRLIAKAQLRRTSIHHNTFCNGCRYVPREFRIICLICTNKSFLRQVDLCTGCMDKPVKVEDLFDHQPVHPVVRASRLVHDRHIGPLNASSWKTFHRAARLMHIDNRIEWEDVTGDEANDTETVTEMGDDEFSVVLCVCCTKPVFVPFWICVTCYTDHETDVIICTDCDLRRCYDYGPHTNHRDYHPLVRFQYLEPTTSSEFMSLEAKLLALDTTINERLDRLEKRHADQDLMYGDRFDRSEMSMERRIAELEVHVDRRFDAVETLLRALAAKIGVQ